MGDKTRVAILGGGAAALTAAFELTSPDNPRCGDYEVTIYQLGWRLGGKGASGRNMQPEYSRRIEEHGIHAFMGFYDNAFRLMQKVYDELKRPLGAPLRTWKEAFAKIHSLVLFEEYDGAYCAWPIEVPDNGETPGEGKLSPSLLTYVRRGLRMLRDLFFQARSVSLPSPRPGRWWARGFRKVRDKVGEWVVGLILGLSRFFVPARLDRLRIYLQRMGCFGCVLSALLRALENALLFVAEIFLGCVRWIAWRIYRHRVPKEPLVRRLWITLNFAIANALGIMKNKLWVDGLDSINDSDYQDWLAPFLYEDGGLTRQSPLTRFLYDAGFAYVKGKPEFEAGTCLRIMIRLFLTYRGAIAYKMEAGMGDVVFAPLYEVLLKRGVKFEFFHRVKDLSPDLLFNREIETIELEQQVSLLDGPYQPLIDVKGLPCWPAEPLWDQLVPGGSLGFDFESYAPSPWGISKVLRLGEDFDHVILGISLGALPCVAGKLIGSNPDWQQMVSAMGTVRTQALQVWTSPTLEELGWKASPPPFSACFTPNNLSGVWADMSQTISREDWPPPSWPLLWEHHPRSVSYFCGVMEDLPGDPGCLPLLGDEEVKEHALFLLGKIGPLWPNAIGDKQFLWNLLIDNRMPPGVGAERLGAQFWVSIHNPSDRYVLSRTGSSQYRLPAGGPPYRNLTLTGDWIQNTFNAGAVESAVMSGMAASGALSGYPSIQDIAGWGFGEPERLRSTFTARATRRSRP